MQHALWGNGLTEGFPPQTRLLMAVERTNIVVHVPLFSMLPGKGPPDEFTTSLPSDDSKKNKCICQLTVQNALWTKLSRRFSQSTCLLSREN